MPLSMVLETEDLQALDLLSSSRAIVVRLRRRLRTHADTGKTVDAVGWKDAIEFSQLAAWWPSAEGAPDNSNGSRRIDGELHLPADLKPTSAMAHFRIEVCHWFNLVTKLFIDFSFPSIPSFCSLSMLQRSNPKQQNHCV